MKKLSIFVFLLFFVFTIAVETRAEGIFSEDFNDNTGFTLGSGLAHYWGIAPLSGTSSFPSYFTTGTSGQSDNIFYGSYGKGSVDAPTMSIALPDLTGYTNLHLIVSLAAPYNPQGTMWEITHRDRLVISSDKGTIDTFRPISGASPLRSQLYLTDLGYIFQDYEYPISNDLKTLIFEFASSADDETVGIDSVRITGDRIAPTHKNQCKNTGWENFPSLNFKNQGDCVSYVESSRGLDK